MTKFSLTAKRASILAPAPSPKHTTSLTLKCQFKTQQSQDSASRAWPNDSKASDAHKFYRQLLARECLHRLDWSGNESPKKRPFAEAVTPLSYAAPRKNCAQAVRQVTRNVSLHTLNFEEVAPGYFRNCSEAETKKQDSLELVEHTNEFFTDFLHGWKHIAEKEKRVVCNVDLREISDSHMDTVWFATLRRISTWKSIFSLFTKFCSALTLKAGRGLSAPGRGWWRAPTPSCHGSESSGRLWRNPGTSCLKCTRYEQFVRLLVTIQERKNTKDGLVTCTREFPFHASATSAVTLYWPW